MMSTPSSKPQASIRDRVTEMARMHRDRASLPDMPLDAKWADLVLQEPRKLFNADGSVNFDNLANFRRLRIFVSDLYPNTDFATPDASSLKALAASPVKGAYEFVKERIGGVNRSWRSHILHDLSLLEKDGALDMLRRYPIDKTPGNPFVMRARGCAFNLRWLRHVYFNTLVNKHIGAEIDDRKSFINLDIGCSYSVFSYMFKSEHPNATCVLVDFPDQLILSYWFLGNLFPDAKFATLADFADRETIDRAFLEQFDFVLLPVPQYGMLQADSLDMVSNFFSLGEMRREWFEGYMTSDPFRTARYFLTSNRFESSPRMEPTYDTDLTILDYPLGDFERLHFGVYPLHQCYFKSKGYVFTETRSISSHNFDFLGRRKET